MTAHGRDGYQLIFLLLWGKDHCIDTAQWGDWAEFLIPDPREFFLFCE